MLYKMNKYIPCTFIYTDKNLLYNIGIESKYLIICLNFLKNYQNLRFKVLSTISCTDYPELINRFELNYILMSIDYPFIINLKFKISEFDNVLSSIYLYKSAIWLEREIWDMFGVYYINNYDLRRILTDYGYPYHPLRKTFPLQGFIQIHYNFIKKKIFYINNKYSQQKALKRLINVWSNLS